MTPTSSPAEPDILRAVAKGTGPDPVAVLGRHGVTIDGRPAVIVRTMQPSATAVELITSGRVTPMPKRLPSGLFEARLPLDEGTSPEELGYSLRIHEGSVTREVVDPYQFGQVLSDYDLHLFSEGTHLRAWEKFGAHPMSIGAVAGVH